MHRTPPDASRIAVPPVGPLASPRCVADLAGLSVSRVLELVRAGTVKAERIRGAVFVSLDDVDAAARDRGTNDDQ